MKKLLFIFLLLVSPHVFAASCEATRPIHSAWFYLDGFHKNVVCSCTSCHVNNTFKGTPRTCIGCHIGRGGAMPKTPTHIATNLGCETCHAPADISFTTGKMNHVGIVAGCDTCHGGQSFGTLRPRSKSLRHIPTTLSCENCHKSTANWNADWRHQGVVAGSCSTCHSKSAIHIPTAVTTCDSCHKDYSSFIGVSPTTMHAVSSPLTCTTCHNGAYLAVSPKCVGVPTTVDHVPMAGATCDTCHNNNTWVCE